MRGWPHVFNTIPSQDLLVARPRHMTSSLQHQGGSVRINLPIRCQHKAWDGTKRNRGDKTLPTRYSGLGGRYPRLLHSTLRGLATYLKTENTGHNSALPLDSSLMRCEHISIAHG